MKSLPGLSPVDDLNTLAWARVASDLDSSGSSLVRDPGCSTCYYELNKLEELRDENSGLSMLEKGVCF